MKKAGLLFFLFFVSLIHAYIAYDYKTLHPGESVTVEGYKFKLDDVESRTYADYRNFDIRLHMGDNYEMDTTPPWTIKIGSLQNTSGVASVTLEFYYGGTSTLAGTETINEGDSETVFLPGDDIEITVEDLSLGYTFSTQWADLHMVNYDNVTTYNAIVSIIGTSDNILKKDKLNTDQTKEFYLVGDAFEVTPTEIHYDAVMSARYATLRIIMTEKDESIKVTVNLVDYLTGSGATVYMYDADTREMLFSLYAEYGKDGEFELPIDDEYVYFYASYEGTEYGGSDYKYRGYGYGDERKVCTPSQCIAVEDDYSHVIVLYSEEEPEEEPEELVYCSDTDGGAIYTTRGVLRCWRGTELVYDATDYCVGSTLYEYYYTSSGAGDSYHYTTIPCTYGCEDGKCLSAPSPEEETPPPPPPLPQELEEINYTINLSAGWNMISLPYSYERWSHDCGELEYDDIWEYDSQSDRYAHPSKLEAGKGYWAYTGGACSIILEDISDAYYVEGDILREGWNFMGVGPEAVPLSYIEDSCTIKRGPWLYDPATERYKRASVFEPGKGYFVNVENDCTIGAALPPPPG